MSLNYELGGLKVLTFVTRYEFCNLLGLKVCPAALGGSWFYAPFEGVTVKPPALPVVLDSGLCAQLFCQELYRPRPYREKELHNSGPNVCIWMSPVIDKF